MNRFFISVSLTQRSGIFKMNKDEFVELLAKSQEAILERVDSKLQDLKRSISEDQEDCVRSVVKKFKEDHSIKWKKVGNEKQFKFNESVEAKIDSAIAAVDKKKLDKVKKELEEGKQLLTDRQKLIKLADRSECGWATVSAYVTDDLADTPDDERRISKAEKSAKKALESKREKSRAKSGSTNYKSNHASLSFVSDSRRGTDDAFKSFRQPFQFRQAAFLPRSQFRRGTCFACGSEGHWRNNCPNITPSTRSDKSTK